MSPFSVWGYVAEVIRLCVRVVKKRVASVISSWRGSVRVVTTVVGEVYGQPWYVITEASASAQRAGPTWRRSSYLR